MARWTSVLLALTILASGAPAQAGSARDGYQRSYDAGLRCFVVNSYFSQEFQKRGDTANTALFKDKSRLAFDAATYSGQELGMGKARIEADMRASMDAELPRLARDQAYLTESAKFCKANGLM